MQIPALKRLFDLPEVAAVFVYDSHASIVASAVPPNYTEAVLAQVVLRVRRVVGMFDKAQIRKKELRFSFEGFTIWLKFFGDGTTMVVFVEPHTDFTALRQPINLTAINVDKTLNNQLSMDTSQVVDGGKTLAQMAQMAEMELLSADGDEQSNEFMEKLLTIVEFFIGPQGPAVVRKAVRELDISLPFANAEVRQGLINFCADRIPNVELRQGFLDTVGDMVERLADQGLKAGESPGAKK